jgi:HSP20 family protein
MSTRNDITTSTSSSSTQDQRRAVQPAIDVFETDASITLLADMPGVPRDQLEIQGEAKPQIAADLEPLWAEVRTPRFRRSFTLSRELDTSRIEANLKDGVLTLRIPKHAQAQPRRIPVSA